MDSEGEDVTNSPVQNSKTAQKVMWFDLFFQQNGFQNSLVEQLSDRGTQRFVSGNICSESLKSSEIFANHHVGLS